MEGELRIVAQAERILSLGVEKIAISSAIVKNPKLINSFSDSLGAQSMCSFRC